MDDMFSSLLNEKLEQTKKQQAPTRGSETGGARPEQNSFIDKPNVDSNFFNSLIMGSPDVAMNQPVEETKRDTESFFDFFTKGVEQKIEKKEPAVLDDIFASFSKDKPQTQNFVVEAPEENKTPSFFELAADKQESKTSYPEVKTIEFPDVDVDVGGWGVDDEADDLLGEDSHNDINLLKEKSDGQ